MRRDRTENWTEADLTFRAEYWDALVLPEVKVSATAATFNVAAIYDPCFRTPWLLASPVKLAGPVWRGLYRDRWSVEQIPLAGKQMLGGARQFVFAVESRYRLPELILFRQCRKTRFCHPFVALRAGSERVGPVRSGTARFQRRVSLRHRILRWTLAVA
ncbi:MAG: hypothetical protein NT169_02705, partial [Chloroflexi bacterium]|nr:hypothetical protein [Chloroflexota bacterium]